MISQRVAMRYHGRWSDSVELWQEPADELSLGDGRYLVSRCHADLDDLSVPVPVHETTLDPTLELPELGTNSESTVVLFPTSTLSGSVIADRLLGEDQFWKLLGSGPSQVTMALLRRTLQKQTREVVLAFQARLIERCGILVKRRGFSWSLAGSLLLVGRASFETHMAGDSPLPGDSSSEFADLTDIAEDIIGARIEVPGYGDSRTGLGASRPAAVAPVRWLSWRSFAARDDDVLEAFYFGERPAGVPMREMLPVVRRAMVRDGLELLTNIETWVPDMVQQVPAPFLVPYEIRRRGPEDFAEYLREHAIQGLR